MKAESVPIWRKEVLTPRELSMLVAEGEETIKNLCRQGRIPSYKSGVNYNIPRRAAIDALTERAINMEGHERSNNDKENQLEANQTNQRRRR